MQGLRISPGVLPAECEALRTEVRAFLAEQMAGMPVAKRVRNWSGSNPEFTRAMAARGWIGMTWPKRYGGHERSSLERYVVLEEMLAAGAPVGAHWVADRQSGPLLMRFSPDVLAPRYLPRIVRGEAYFCIGMSEPDSGSDLASIRTRAVSHRGRLGDQRPQGVDLARAPRAPHDRAGAHRRTWREQTRRAVAAAARHEDTGHHGAPDHQPAQRTRLQRGDVRRRRGAARPSDRHRGRGLEAGRRRTGVRTQRSRAVPDPLAGVPG